MKNVLKTTAAVIALTAVFAAPASADVSVKQLSRDIQFSMGAGSHLIVRESDGVVTLTGYYADILDKQAAIRIARNTEGVTKVVNHAFAR